MPTPSLQAIRYSRGSLELLDQLQLPHQSKYVRIHTCEDGFIAIKRMVVRGAPAIAIVAALALAVELTAFEPGKLSRDDMVALIQQKLDYLVQSRPTAVNLADAAEKLKALVRQHSGTDITACYVAAAERMLVDDVADNKAIGDLGAEWILKNAQSDGEKVSVLTHCNTGSLATAGYGTALGIIRSLYSTSKLSHVYCTETRPYNQGARLTAYELVYEKIPATLITDSMAAALLNLKSINCIVVGADRVARNGDTANKIGTYQLAIIARHHSVKFVVAAPTTSIDMNTVSGQKIVIEERPGKEVVTLSGPRVEAWNSDGASLDLDHVQTISTAATGIGIFNPAFDVTPKDLIDAIVTERGVAVKSVSGEFELEKIFS